MPVIAADLKIIAASLASNAPTSGGLPSSRVIPDNVVNSLFSGITSTELVAGGQDWRKVFIGPQNADSAALYGAGLYLTAPTDSHVGYYALAATSFADTLADVQTALSQPADYRTGLRAYGSIHPTANAPINATTISANTLVKVSPMLSVDTSLPGTVVPTVMYHGLSKAGVLPVLRAGDVVRISEGVNSSEHVAVAVANIAMVVQPATATSLGSTGVAVDESQIVLYEDTPNNVVRFIHQNADFFSVNLGNYAMGNGSFLTDYTLRDPVTNAPILMVPAAAWTATGMANAFVEVQLQSAIFSDIAASQTITLAPPLPRAYTTAATITSRMPLGDRAAYVASVFDMETWTGEWSDVLVGNPASATYDTAGAPIIVTNKGAISERFVFHFDSPDSGVLIGEKTGAIFSGPISGAIAPINPNTGAPYLSIPATGWGSGWGYDNAVRINVNGALAPVWLLRAVQPGATSQSVSVTATIAGDIDQA
jgi:hypothetical protein